MSKFWKVLCMPASVMLLCGASLGQTPPPDRHSLPHLPQTPTLLLEADFNLNAGAASTKERVVSLNFTAREKSDPGHVTIRDATANVTHYRVIESTDSTPDKLSQQSWIPLATHPEFDLALRNGRGQRYGERRVVLQVKTETLTSNVVSDTILLEPVLKEYRVSASGHAHPLIQYAAAQGFQFPLNFFETCQSDCLGDFTAAPDLDSGSALVSVRAPLTARPGDRGLICVLAALGGNTLLCSASSAPSASGICTTKADYLLFTGRSPNQFWRIKSVALSNAYVVPHGVNRFLAKFSFENKNATCLPPSSVEVGDVVVEGPEVDDFVDTANPWKNAFIREPSLIVRP